MPKRLGYAILFVSDVEGSVRFYRDVLGVPLRFANETYAEFVTEGAKFALYARHALPALIGAQTPGAQPHGRRVRWRSSSRIPTASTSGCGAPA